MKGSCAINANVSTNEGLKRSRLFENLLHYTPSRREANKNYYIGTNERFLNKVRDIAEFDENGEITYESLNDLIDLGISDDKLKEILDKELKVGTYRYDEAVERIRQFNSNSPYRSKYLATMTLDDRGYHISIVENTFENRVTLVNTIKNQEIQSKLIDTLNNLGVSVDFLTEAKAYRGRYSTANAVKTSDGLYNLIEISKGANVNETLAEEAGHFAVAALGDDPLVQRLVNALSSEEVRRQAIGSEYDSKVLGENPAKEVAGDLVGKALIRQLSNKGFINKLAHRVASLAKRIFARLKGDTVMQNKLDAERVAEDIANSFLEGGFNGTAETAVSKKETFFAAEKSINVETFEKVVTNLRMSVDAIKAAGSSNIAKNIEKSFKKLVDGRLEFMGTPTILSDHLAMEGILEWTTALVDLLENTGDIRNMLANLDFGDSTEFFDRMAMCGRTLVQVEEIVRNAALVGDILSAHLHSSTVPFKFAGVSQMQLENLHLNLLRVTTEMKSVLEGKRVDYFCAFCEHITGRKSIHTQKRLLFSRAKVEGTNSESRIAAEQTISFKSMLGDMEKDISLFDRFVSMSNNPDLISQIADICVKQAKHKADLETNEAWDELRVLEAEWKELGLGKTQRVLYETITDDEGKEQLSGNIISDLKWGEWEEERNKKIAQIKAEFMADPSNITSSEVVNAIKLDEFMSPRMKEWNKEHSVWNTQKNMWEPSRGGMRRGVLQKDYSNPEFNRIMNGNPTLKAWYDKYMNIKAKLDSKLPEGATIPVRVPQFRANFTDRVRSNRLLGDKNSLVKAVGKSLRSWLLDKFCDSTEDYDLGCMTTYNSLGEDIFRNKEAFEKEKPRRLALYGINKVRDFRGSSSINRSNELSTDLLHNTLSYAAMANTYNALNAVVSTLEVGANQIQSRTVKKLGWYARRKKSPLVFTRYMKYLDKQVYGVSFPRAPRLWGKLAPEKIVRELISLGAKMFLGFNYTGGMVNTGTGIVEIFKEACAGEYMTLADLKFANKEYFRNLGRNWINGRKQAKDDYMSLFCRHFDARNTNTSQYRDWRTTRSGLYNIAAEIPMIGYKSGDHYMQIVPYVAAAHNTPLYSYDRFGNETVTNVYDIYEAVDITDSNGKVVGRTLKMKGGTYFTSRENKQTYDMIDAIIGQIQVSQGGGLQGAATFSRNLTQEQKLFLRENRLSTADLTALKSKLVKLKDNYVWGEKEESDFINRAREVNNRMHGIYNKLDEVEFSQSLYGAMLLSMRGWVLGMLERRILTDRYSLVLDRNVEGSLVTMAKGIHSAFVDDLGCMRTLAAMLLPISSKATDQLIAAGMSKTQLANVKRHGMDTLFIALFMILKLMTAKPDDDDDDEPSVGMGIGHYFATRLLMEQDTLTTIWGWIRERENILNITAAGLSAVIEILRILYEAAGAVLGSTDDSDFYRQQDEPGKYEEGDPVVIDHVLRYSPFRSMYTFTHPYEATKNYEFGAKHRK